MAPIRMALFRATLWKLTFRRRHCYTQCRSLNILHCCHCEKCHSASCHYDECHSAICYLIPCCSYPYHFDKCHSASCHFNECHSTSCHFDECHTAACHSAVCYSEECCSTVKSPSGFITTTWSQSYKTFLSFTLQKNKIQCLILA
jgi:hypothetical protein